MQEMEPERKNVLDGLWSPIEIADAVGLHRQTIVDTMNGKGVYPGELPVVRFGQQIYTPEAYALAYIHWRLTGECQEVQRRPEGKLYWTISELATAAGTHRSTVNKAIVGQKGKSGSLNAIKIQGKAWLVRNADALAYIEESTKRSDA